MKYAVVTSGGKQYKVSEGDVIEVAKIDGEKDSKLTFDNVLLSVLDEKMELGKPFLENVKVSGTILEQKKGPKLRIAKFKAKARERSVMGFRPFITTIKIDKIEDKKAKK